MNTKYCLGSLIQKFIRYYTYYKSSGKENQSMKNESISLARQREIKHYEERGRDQTQTKLSSFPFSVVVFARACLLVPTSQFRSRCLTPLQNSPSNAVIFSRLHIISSSVKLFIFLFFILHTLQQLFHLSFFLPITATSCFGADTFLTWVSAAIPT